MLKVMGSRRRCWEVGERPFGEFHKIVVTDAHPYCNREAVGSRKKFREEFVYKLELENQGRDWAIKRWDIYADPEKASPPELNYISYS